MRELRLTTGGFLIKNPTIVRSAVIKTVHLSPKVSPQQYINVRLTGLISTGRSFVPLSEALSVRHYCISRQQQLEASG